VTRLTVDELQPFVPPCEAAFHAHRAAWRLDGRPRIARRYTTDQNCPLPTPEERRLFILVYLKTSPLPVVQGRRFGMGQSTAHQWIHLLLVVLRATRRTLGDAPTRSVQDLAKRLGVAEADGGAADHVRFARGGASTRLPPVGHDGPERRLERPQEPLEQTRWDRGKNRCHTGKNVLLINAALTSLFLRETSAGSTHDTRMAEATPYPLPAGSRLLQELGFLACTLAHVEIILPTKKPRGRALRRVQKAANRRLARRRVRIAPVNSRVKRCRMVHDTNRLRQAGVRDLMMEACCGWHNVRVRLTPWHPMV
jgi:hypothetical protein